jgi:TonB family protein
MRLRSGILMRCGLFVLATSAAASDWKPASDTRACPRKLSDVQIDQILTAQLPIKYAHTTTVNYARCIYGVVIWPNGGPVDSQTPIELDEDGHLPPAVLTYGIRSHVIQDGPAYSIVIAPPYPVRAHEKHITGTVLVRVSIAPDKTVSNARIVRVSPRDAIALTDGLIDAIRRWQFVPLTLYGNPFPSDVVVPVRFSINGSSASDERKHIVVEDIPQLETIEVKSDFVEAK